MFIVQERPRLAVQLQSESIFSIAQPRGRWTRIASLTTDSEEGAGRGSTTRWSRTARGPGCCGEELDQRAHASNLAP